MEREEIIDELSDKLKTFSFYNSFEFERLKSLSIDDIYNETTCSIEVTPLLETIGRYALIYNNLSLEYVKNNVDECYGTLLDESFEIARISAELFEIFFEQHVLHPTILMSYYTNGLIVSLEQAFDCATSLFYLIPMCMEKDKLHDLIVKYNCLTVMKYEQKERDELFPTIITSIINDNIEEVMDILSFYSNYKATLDGGIGDELSLALCNISLQLSLIKEKTDNIDVIEFVDAFNNRYIKNKMLFQKYNEFFGKTELYKELYKKMN